MATDENLRAELSRLWATYSREIQRHHEWVGASEARLAAIMRRIREIEERLRDGSR